MPEKKTARVVGVYSSRGGDRWEIKYINIDGRKKSRYAKTKRAAQALARQLETTLNNEKASAATADLDWYELLKEVAIAAKNSGDYSAAVSAARAAVTFMPPPSQENEPEDLTMLDRDELVGRLIGSLEAEGYVISKPELGPPS